MHHQNSYEMHRQGSNDNPSIHGGASSQMIPSTSSYANHPSTSAYLQPPLISPPIQDLKRASPMSPFANDIWSGSYRNDSQGLSAISHKLHRITFVEACLFQPPDLPSPVRLPAPPLPPPVQAGPQGPVRPVMPVLAQGERSPTSTGGTQYYQEWTSKHMRHLCSRFEKPSQQKLLMNVERKSKYPFIILCTPEPNSSSSASKSSMSSMNKARAYHREISQHSAYSLEDEEDDEEDEEAHWITQKQRDSINNHYLPPPPPPLLMPHIWPEIRYIDGLYTVCASIVRPGSGVADDFDESLYLGQERNAPGVGGGGSGSGYDHANYAHTNMHDNRYNPHEKHISFQDGKSSNDDCPRPAGYIVSAFATFPGEDSERLEKNWLQWTGKQYFESLPRNTAQTVF